MIRTAFCLVLGLLFGSPLSATEAPVEDFLQRPAITVTDPERAVLIDVTRAGQRLVAVGAHGLIIVSDDDGRSWHQVPVPVSVTLTAVDFPTPSQGWAVGHAGSVLHSSDGGDSWHLQLDGETAAQRVLDAVPAESAEDPAQRRLRRVAERFVQDGADKPLLAVHFSDARHGIVAGAFGLILHTADGGETWHSWVDRVDNPEGYHLYALAGQGSRIYMAGEQGSLFASDDNGGSFHRLQTPYEGSYFALQPGGNGDLLLAGLRGNAWRLADQGHQWQRLNSDAQGTLVAAYRLADGQDLLAEQNGRLLQVDNPGARLQLLPQAAGVPVSALAQAGDGGLVVVGSRGVKRLGGSDDQ
ncbi:hypothetical protein KQ940_13800 [Marinobacterium sp. D7]|uniref:WD40/YVTN/BNR-like repeat-containing protein n=1 Tax=Marinobacterium ramblicola TaxID=2849041 RepID=UPI001C2D6F01|nr:YCF48-related protein [Marinobacterium ramblicola]MBV1789128.1 hypothetical protein [Marinobacterium ramblicola]